jgi:hypothetical protein
MSRRHSTTFGSISRRSESTRARSTVDAAWAPLAANRAAQAAACTRFMTHNLGRVAGCASVLERPAGLQQA